MGAGATSTWVGMRPSGLVWRYAPGFRDVVPSFGHRRYVRRDDSGWYVDYGTELKTDRGTRIVNWPRQQYANGLLTQVLHDPYQILVTTCGRLVLCHS